MSAVRFEKLLSREGVDIPTVIEIDKTFYRLVWEFAKAEDELFFTYFDKKKWTHYIGVDQLQLGRRIYKKHFGSPAAIKKYYEDGLALQQKTADQASFWSKKLGSDDSAEALCEALDSFAIDFEKTSDFYSITCYLAIEAWQHDFESTLSRLLEKIHSIGEKERITASLYAPWKKSAVVEIQEKMKRGESVSNLAREYQFLRSWSIVWHRPIDGAWLKQLAVQTKTKEKTAYSNEEIIALLKPGDEEKRFIELAPFVVFFKDWRDDLRRRQVYAWTFLFQRIAKKLGTEWPNLGYLTLDEIRESIRDGKLKIEAVERRKNNPCVVTMDLEKHELIVLDKTLPAKYLAVVAGKEAAQAHFEVKGTVANGGMIKGRVKVVQSYHDTKNVEVGDVLVANTTHPNYLPAMKRAAAFVTNEGGILSHAAIVARELNKPCVVATKKATIVFKDGDIVEVDASKGVVRLA